MIAHIEHSSGLCYADASLLRLDRCQPGASILRVLEEAKTTIEKSLAGAAEAELAAEYPSYWKGIKFQVLFDLSRTVEKANIAIPNKSHNLDEWLLIQETQRLPTGYVRGQSVLVIKATDTVIPCKEVTVPKTLEEFEIWLNKQTLPSEIAFNTVLEALASKKMVCIAAPNGWLACEADFPADLSYLQKKNPRPKFIIRQLQKRKNEIVLNRYRGQEASLNYMTSKYLEENKSPLSDKKIAVVGCGTIGSHLARFLVQSGAGNGSELLLIDNDRLVAGNLGRHLLNFSDIGKPKAQVLASELSRFHPEVNISSFAGTIKNIWGRILSYDLIVDATGVEAVSEFMNHKALEARAQNTNCNLLHVFVFGNGGAAQSFLNVGEKFACYRCLRPKLDAPWRYDPRKDIKSIGEVTRTSCGDGPYVPYSSRCASDGGSCCFSSRIGFFFWYNWFPITQHTHRS